MPGVLTLKEVEALDLDHWLLLYHGTFVHMIVSSTFLVDYTVFLTILGPRRMGKHGHGQPAVCQRHYRGTSCGSWT